MADREVKIRIGAAIDANFNSVLSAMKDAQKKAAREASAEAQKAAKETAAAEKRSMAEVQAWAKKAAKEKADEAKRVGKASEDAAKRETSTKVAEAKKFEAMRKSIEKSHLDDIKRLDKEVSRSAKERVRIEKAAMKEVEADLRRHNKEREKAEKTAGGGGGQIGRRGFGDRLMTGLAMRAAGAAVGAPMRLAGSMLRGLGVETGLQSQLSGAVDREKLSMDIVNQAWQPNGGGPAGSMQRRNPSQLTGRATQVGIETGTESKDILQGVGKFVAMTGDIQTIEESMKDLAKLSKANGAEFQDMAEAAAAVSNAIGEVPEKGKAVSSVLRALAGQGQMSAIEIRDQAKNLGMLTAQSNFFKIDPLSAKTLGKAGVTNEAGQRIAVMGAMAQIARKSGGRVTAKTAMQSAMAFGRDLANPNEIKRMNAMGISTYTDASHSETRDPLQMFLEVAKKAQVKGGLSRDVINKVFPNQQSRAVGLGFAQSYNESYRLAAEKGITNETQKHQFAMERVTEEYQQILAATQKNEQIDLAFAESLKTADSQAKILNNQLGKAADTILKDFTPALVGTMQMLMPIIEWGSTKLGELLGTKQARDANENLSADMKATSALSNLHGDINQRVFNPEDITAAKNASVELDKQIAVKEAEVKSLNHRGGTDGGYGDLSTDMVKTFAQKGDEGAKKYLEAKESLGSMQNTSVRMAMALERIEMYQQNNMLKEVQKVTIVEDHSKKPGAQPKTPGTANPDSN